MDFTHEEQVWIEACQNEPERFSVEVDNDAVFVVETEKHECVFTFRSYGYEFALALLRHIGCTAEMV